MQNSPSDEKSQTVEYLYFSVFLLLLTYVHETFRRDDIDMPGSMVSGHTSSRDLNIKLRVK